MNPSTHTDPVITTAMRNAVRSRKRRETIQWHDCHCMADVAARILHQERPSKAHHRAGQIMRANAVTSLRWLWRQATRAQRIAIACRIHCWLQTGRQAAWAAIPAQ